MNTAWDEPNNEGTVPGEPTEHVEPTWNQPGLAGEYWHELDTMCEAKGFDCKVGAGDFLDGYMENALHPLATVKSEDHRVLYYNMRAHGKRRKVTAEEKGPREFGRIRFRFVGRRTCRSRTGRKTRTDV
jgi:hypothetical protein